MRFEIGRDSTGAWWWQLRSSNHKTLARSVIGFASPGEADAGARRFAQDARLLNFQVERNRHGQWHWCATSDVAAVAVSGTVFYKRFAAAAAAVRARAAAADAKVAERRCQGAALSVVDDAERWRSTATDERVRPARTGDSGAASA